MNKRKIGYLDFIKNIFFSSEDDIKREIKSLGLWETIYCILIYKGLVFRIYKTFL